MKRIVALFIALAISISLLTACGSKESQNTSQEGGSPSTSQEGGNPSASQGSEELPIIKVAIMPYLNSIPFKYIMDNGLDREKGFEIEPILFPSGGPMNEALAAGLWDVGILGGAAPFALANYGACLIADIADGAGGLALYVRPDSALLNTQGRNPDFPDVYGDPDAARDLTVLCTTGSVGQLNVIRWAEAIGLSSDDLNMVHMEYAQAYQAFLAGEGDIVALNPPLSYEAEKNGWINIGGFNELDILQADSMVVSKDAFENKKELLASLVELVFEVNETLRGDVDLEVSVLSDWYSENGSETDVETVTTEVLGRPLLTKEDAQNRPLGGACLTISEFNVYLGTLEEATLETIRNQIKPDILDMVLAK